MTVVEFGSWLELAMVTAVTVWMPGGYGERGPHALADTEGNQPRPHPASDGNHDTMNTSAMRR